jgi:hypothetical protein
MQNILEHAILDPHTKQYTLHFILENVEVCQAAYFYLRYGNVNKATQRRIMAKVHSGAKQYFLKPSNHFGGVTKKEGTKANQVREDILYLCKIYGEEQVG